MAKRKIKGLSKEEQSRRKKAAAERMTAEEGQAETAAGTRVAPAAEDRTGERGAAAEEAAADPTGALLAALAGVGDEDDDEDNDEDQRLQAAHEGPPVAVRVKKGDIPEGGRTLPTRREIHGRIVNIARAPGGGSNLANAFIVMGELGDDEVHLVETNTALENILAAESGITGEITDGVLRVGARMSEAELRAVAREWKPLFGALAEAQTWSAEEEEKLLKGMTTKSSKPGTVLNALKILELLPQRVLGSPESGEEVKAATEIMEAGRRAATARQEKAAELERTRLGATGGGGGAGQLTPADASIGSWAAVVDAAAFTASDASSIQAIIDSESGVFNERVNEPAGRRALAKASQAKNSVDLQALTDTVTQEVQRRYPDINRTEVAIVIKADFNKDNAEKKLGALTNKAGMEGLAAAMKRVAHIAHVAGLQEEYNGVEEIRDAVEARLAGVEQTRIDDADHLIRETSFKQVGQHGARIARSRSRGELLATTADVLAESTIKKTESLAMALSTWADALALGPRGGATPPSAAPSKGAAGKITGKWGKGTGSAGGQPAGAGPGIGAGGNKTFAAAIADLKKTIRGTEATTPCPFLDTALGCTKPSCPFKH